MNNAIKPIRQLTLEDARIPSLVLSRESRFVISATRRFDHITSIHAARDAHARVSRHRELALRLHAAHPAGLTDFELADFSHVAQTSIGKRRKDLMDAGLIEPTDLTRPAPSGSAARVWRITEKGMSVYLKLADRETA